MQTKEKRAAYDKSYRHTIHRKYSDLKRNAKTRACQLTLTVRELALITARPCWYCGTWENKNQVGEPCPMGVDQLDPKHGYTIENTVPCCWDCNRAKCDTTRQIAERIVLARELKQCNTIVQVKTYNIYGVAVPLADCRNAQS